MNSSHRFFEGLCVGGLLGFLFGILWAPKSGAELRKQISNSSDELYKQASSTLSDLKDRTDQALQDFQHKSDAVLKQAQTHVQETRDQLTAKLQDLTGSTAKVSVHDDIN